MQFDFSQPIFGAKKTIPEGTQVVFVSDMFADEYVGGAELTSQALIDSCPLRLHRVKSRDVTFDLLASGKDAFWVFGNFSNMDLNLIPSIIGNEMRYAVLEYDYKYCKYRSPEKHAAIEGSPCDCQNEMHGKLISAFYYGAKSLWWMSEKQQQRYHTMFPFLEEKESTVLSSVFDDQFFVTIKSLRQKHAGSERKGWIVLGSTSWVKGQDAAVQWCKDNGKEHEIVWNLPYLALLEKLARAEGFVYLPAGGDTCPRMVIEAKLLGCKLVLNDNVQHRDEEWFATEDLDDTEAYLYLSRSRFWEGVKSNMQYRPRISGYTTTYNCAKQGYPFRESIKSMLEFCDEVVVVDGGSTDDTLDCLAWLAYPDVNVKPGVEEIELVENLRVLMHLNKAAGAETFEFPDSVLDAKKDPRIKVKVIPRDWDHPRFAVFDGLQKAEARKLCTGDFCWQQDSDEVVHPDDAQKIRDIASRFPPGVSMLALPVVEYWGGADKVRIDVMPWKWRISRNDPDITHGIPIHLRKTDAAGNAYAAPGTDGCDMISTSTGEPVPFGTFYTADVDRVRYAALGDPQALAAYENWLNAVVSELPTVFHFSWWNLPNKMRLYKRYWTAHWESLRGEAYVDTADTNMMFDVPWSEVTDAMIIARAEELKQIGGWIWHAKWQGQKTPWITCHRPPPQSGVDFYASREKNPA